MNRGLTRLLVGIVATFVIVAVVAFAFVVTSFSKPGAGTAGSRSAIPSIVHPASASMADCVRCHALGPDGMPPNHGNFGAATCLTCHRIAPGAPSPASDGPEGEAGPVPHLLAAPYDDCAGCHAIGGNLSMPADHDGFANADCADCHANPAAK